MLTAVAYEAKVTTRTSLSQWATMRDIYEEKPQVREYVPSPQRYPVSFEQQATAVG